MEATRLRLRVSPGASRPGIVGRHGQAWKVRVAAPPEQGRANAAVTDLLAQTCSVPRDAVVVIAGHGSREKVVELAGIDSARVEECLASAATRKANR